jgi:RHS repeat-associated protein
MTDGSGTPVWRAEYRPFGDLFSSSTGDNLRFPGQYFDSETGLSQNWFRDYSPKTGRYAESDPIGLEGGTNPYSYVHNQPTGQIDPAGLESWSDGLWRRLIELLSPEPTPDPVREREQRELADAAGVNPATGETRIAGLGGAAAARRGAKEGIANVGAACTEQIALQYGAPKALEVLVGGAFAITRSLSDLGSLRGATIDEIRPLIPESWIEMPLRKGKGTRFVNPARPGEAIMIEEGWPGATDPLHSGPYLRVSRDGRITRIPLAGNPTVTP